MNICTFFTHILILHFKPLYSIRYFNVGFYKTNITVNVISQTIVSAVEQQSATVNEISKNISGVSAGAQEVSKNVSESATGLSEVSATIAGVNNAVADTAKGIVQVKTSAEELSKLSEGLKVLLGQFKI